MLTIAYIADGRGVKSKRLTPQQKLHQVAVASLVARKIHDKAKAMERFAPELAELEKLELQLKKITQTF